MLWGNGYALNLLNKKSSLGKMGRGGRFLGEGDAKIPAEKGDILISEIREPHRVEAETNMRILVTIAPPI